MAMIAMLALETAPVAAQPEATAPKVVVELFTSEACYKCPPADAFLTRLAERDDVIALSLSVDLWDFLGWPDPLAHSGHTSRQMGYNDHLSGQDAFTPQIVIDGMALISGGQQDDVVAAIDTRVESLDQRVPVTVDAADGVLTITVDAADTAPPEGAPVYLFAYRTHERRTVGGGANAGMTVDRTNAVFALEKVATWTGAAVSVNVPIPADETGHPEGIAVVIQNGPYGTVLGSAQASLNE